MCSGKVLAAVYYDVFAKHIQPESLKDRIKIQKAIYLINEMGVSFGDYNFIWYKYGPYSYMLDKDTRAVSKDDIKTDGVNDFNNRAKQASEFVREIMKKPDFTKYSTTEWAEVTGSLHYIKSHMYYGLDDKEILKKLHSIKPALKHEPSNSEALHRVSKLRVIGF